MKKVLEYQSKRNECIEEATAIIDKAEEEERTLTDEEKEKHDELTSKAEGWADMAERRIKSLSLEEEARQYYEGRLSQGTEPSEGPIPQGFNSFGEMLIAVANASTGRSVDNRLVWDNGLGGPESRAATGMSEGVLSDGGYLVQQDFVQEIIKRSYQTGQLISKCRKMQISGSSNSMKINGIDETSRVDGSRWGGIRMYWTAEAAEKTASAPKFRQIELNLKKIIGLVYATDELLQDAGALQSVVMQAMSEELGFKLDDAVMNGTGAGQPVGINTHAAMISVPKESGQTADTIVAANVWKMFARMWARSLPNAEWFINQDCWPEIYNLSLAVGTGGSALYVPPGGMSASPYGSLLGKPVTPLEQCATVGDAGDIIFADMSQYLLAEKGGMQSASSIHVRFIYDESVFRFVYRVDGQPLWHNTLTPFKGSNTLSPFIRLAERA